VIKILIYLKFFQTFVRSVNMYHLDPLLEAFDVTLVTCSNNDISQ